jgi:RNA polymerase sigma-70 factor (ECF subfamily)
MSQHKHVGSLADDELLQKVVEGCADCFEQLFRRYDRQVFAVAHKILRDRTETEDILQEVFLSIYLQKERFDPARGSVRTWILQFAYFKALLRRRYLNIRKFYRHEEAADAREIRRAQSSELMGMTPAEWPRYLEKGIAALSPRQRQVIDMVHFEGYTLQEAAQILRESLANTRNHYYRGLRALRDFLTANHRPSENVVLERNNAFHFES